MAFSDVFPIPMRGNEPSFGFAVPVTYTRRFPIPMRGNEETLAKRRTSTPRFPIPMRGNEDIGTSGLNLSDATVPDPHEG